MSRPNSSTVESLIDGAGWGVAADEDSVRRRRGQSGAQRRSCGGRPPTGSEEALINALIPDQTARPAKFRGRRHNARARGCWPRQSTSVQGGPAAGRKLTSKSENVRHKPLAWGGARTRYRRFATSRLSTARPPAPRRPGNATCSLAAVCESAGQLPCGPGGPWALGPAGAGGLRGPRPLARLPLFASCLSGPVSRHPHCSRRAAKLSFAAQKHSRRESRDERASMQRASDPACLDLAPGTPAQFAFPERTWSWPPRQTDLAQMTPGQAAPRRFAKRK